jgi:prolyl oligopeptidase
MKPQFPPTRIEMVTDCLHGVEVKDPYRWLEDASAPEVKAWTARQTGFLRETLDGSPERAWLERRLWQIFESGNLGVPISTRGPDGQGIRLFFTEQTGRQNHPVLYVREGWDCPNRPLIDPNELAADGHIALDWWFPSQDGVFVAYGLSRGGDEESTLRILEVATGRVLPEVVPRTTACSLVWLSTGKGFYYTRYPLPGSVPVGEEHYHRHVFFHQLGTDAKNDPRVFGEGVGWSKWPMVTLSLDDRFLVIEVLDGPMRTDVFVLDTQASPPTRAVPAAEGHAAVSTVVGVGKDCVYVVCNEDAPRGRLMAFDPRAPHYQGWRVVLPESEDTLESVAIARDKIIALYQKDAVSALRGFSTDGRPESDLPLPGLGTVSGLSGHPDQTDVFFTFTSFLVPGVVFRHDTISGQTAVWKQIAARIDPRAFTVRQVRYRSKDGTSVPMFLVHRKGLIPDGKNPALLYGYGGFNISLSPWFAPLAIPFIERGGVFAVANLRGGGEYGERWHRAGVLEKKQNVFDDFIAAGEYLIRENITSRNRLAISGRSNGGLLVAAAITQRPDLFHAAICGVPVTDMIRYHLFRGARLWSPEYGCCENPEHFPWLHAYSPYHRVSDGTAYPATLIFTSETDGRVDPMHARKMAARLQAATAGPGTIVLRTESEGGHGAGKPSSGLVDQHLDELVFLFDHLGMRGTSPSTQETGGLS